MKKVASISGGKSSAYMAANFEFDAYVFALVRIEDKRCSPKDTGLIRAVEDKIGCEFIATAEEDLTLRSVLDLEQYIGKRIDWVTGETFEQLIDRKGGFLPNRQLRICTTELKLRPMFAWWHQNFNAEPIEMGLGFRANEGGRVLKTLDKLNENGLSVFSETFEKLPDGRNKWEQIAWQKPYFPLYENGIYKADIEKFWQDKGVTFPEKNNCVGCFHRNPIMLNMIANRQPEKMNWFADQEERTGNRWKKETTYRKIIKHNTQMELDFSDFSDCDSGYCGI